MFFPRRRIAYAVACAAAVVVLAWPVGEWLEFRERLVYEGYVPDAIYLVAGSKDQERRIAALVGWHRTVLSRPAILVGNDRLKGCWSSERQANLTRAEWSARALRERLPPKSAIIEIVPGTFGGTDGEMEALSRYLAGHGELRRLVIVTSPFHVRRALWRLDVYLDRRAEVRAVVAEARWSDRAPWTVLGELLKMGRDVLGLSRVPLLSRRQP